VCQGLALEDLELCTLLAPTTILHSVACVAHAYEEDASIHEGNGIHAAAIDVACQLVWAAMVLAEFHA